MAWTGLTLTVDGQRTLNQAQISKTMNFKSIVIGDGAVPANFRTLKGLVHQIFEITDLKIDVTENGCTLTADFPRMDFDYYFREIGIVVTTEEGDRLYVYDNCGDDAQYIVSTTGAETTQKRLRLSLAVADVDRFTVSAPGILYVSYDDFENTVEMLDNTIKAKAEQTELDEHVQDSSIHMTDSEKNKLAGIADGANNYVHPDTHPAGMIVPDAGHRFVTDAEKNNWNEHMGDKSNPHGVTKMQVGLENADNTSDMDKPVSTAQQTAIDGAYENSNRYTDEKIAALINGAPTTLDTLKEIADAMEENQNVVAALEESIGKKANESEFDSHVKDKSNPHNVTKAQLGLENVANERQYSASNPQPSVTGSSGSCTGNAATATKWQTARNINGMSVDGSANRANYGTCTTAAATAAKVVSCTGFALVAGAEITVYFQSTNTAKEATLNVNSTGAKQIYYGGSPLEPNVIRQSHTYTFRYNGTYYLLVGEAGAEHPFFENGDTTLNPGGWTDVPLLISGSKITTLLSRISTMFKNVRYLYEMMRTSVTFRFFTINALEINANYFKDYTVNIHVDGYSPMSLSGYQTTAIQVIPYKIMIETTNENAVIGLRNTSSSNLNASSNVIFIFKVMYVKNGLYTT